MKHITQNPKPDTLHELTQAVTKVRDEAGSAAGAADHASDWTTKDAWSALADLAGTLLSILDGEAKSQEDAAVTTTKTVREECFSCGREREFTHTYRNGQHIESMCTVCGVVDTMPYDDED